MTELETLKLVGNWGTAGGALWISWILARKLDRLTDTLVDVMRTTVDRNTEALTRVNEALHQCTKHGP